jgi:hypothetical protein
MVVAAVKVICYQAMIMPDTRPIDRSAVVGSVRAILLEMGQLSDGGAIKPLDSLGIVLALARIEAALGVRMPAALLDHRWFVSVDGLVDAIFAQTDELAGR